MSYNQDCSAAVEVAEMVATRGGSYTEYLRLLEKLQVSLKKALSWDSFARLQVFLCTD